MDNRQRMAYGDDMIDLSEWFSQIRKAWWKIALLSLLVGVATLAYLLQTPNIYQATAVITPPPEEIRQNPALGALGSFGIEIGGSSKLEDLETIFKSKDLCVRVFKKYDLWPIALKDRFDPATRKLRASWTDRLLRRANNLGEPGDWDAIRTANRYLRVSVNKKVGTVSVSFESPSAESAANVVTYFLDEGKSRLQEEALDRASKNKKFIEEQIGKTVDPLTRDRLYALYGQEVEREMMARNREQFGFRVIDHPRIPDRKSRPQRAAIASLATVLSAFFWCIFFVFRVRKSGDVPKE